MGILEGLLGGEPDDDAAGEKYAILLNAGPEDAASAANAFNYAVEFDDAGYRVRLFLDGRAARWPAEFADSPDRPFHDDWERVRRRGLLAGACGYCADAFGAVDACERAGVTLLSDSDAHAPAVAELAAEGYEILAVG